MFGLLNTTLFLAQAAAEGAPNGGDDAGGGDFQIWPLLAIIFVLFYLMVLRPQKNKEKEFKSLVENLKKNDRVVTIGGIHGVITNVQRDADRITLRVDETTGATIRVGAGAISRVVTDDDKSGGDRGKKA